MRPHRQAALALLTCIALTACASVDAGGHFIDGGNALLRIAVLPPLGFDHEQDHPGLHFNPGLVEIDPRTHALLGKEPDEKLTAAEAMQLLLVIGLRREGAATWVMAASDQGEAMAHGADLFIRPVLRLESTDPAAAAKTSAAARIADETADSATAAPATAAVSSATTVTHASG